MDRDAKRSLPLAGAIVVGQDAFRDGAIPVGWLANSRIPLSVVWSNTGNFRGQGQMSVKGDVTPTMKIDDA